MPSESRRLEDEIETLRSRREMLEIDSASYSSTTLSKWKERLECARKQREESEVRNQRLVEDAREMSSEYLNRARVAQTSQHAFAYEIAVKEYMKRVRKILPDWVRSIQTSEQVRRVEEKGYAPPSRRKESSSTTNYNIQERSPDVKKESSPLSKPREEQKQSLVFQQPAKHQPSPRSQFSPKVETEATREEDDSTDNSPPPSPAFLPVQTSTFTNMVVKSDGPTKTRRTPERAVPDAEDVQGSSPRSSTSPYQVPTQVAPDNVTPEKSNSSYEPKSSSKADKKESNNTPIGVKFSREARDYEEDSQDTMDSYSYTESPQRIISPIAQNNSQSQVYYSESERSPASVAQARLPHVKPERASGGGVADRRREESPLRTPVKLSVALPQPSTSQGKDKTKASGSFPVANEEEEVVREKKVEVAQSEKKKEKEAKTSPAPQARSNKSEMVNSAPKHEIKTAKETPKVTTFANRTFDTDTDDSEVSYPSYQSQRPSTESSDEFDF